MLKIAILCAFSGILFILTGVFWDWTQITPQPSKPCFFVQSNTLNVRNAPNLEAQIIGKLQQNFQICEYSKAQNGFLQIHKGWIATKYLALEPFKMQTQNSIQTLAQAQKLRDSKAYLKDLKSSKAQNKPKFKLTSTTKDSALTFPSHKQVQDSTQMVVLEQIIQARTEMKNQNYAQAKNLALRANLANPKNLESWEIFTKSLYLEGNAQEAILVLQNFLQQNYDEDLANLLKRMQQGHKI